MLNFHPQYKKMSIFLPSPLSTDHCGSSKSFKLFFINQTRLTHSPRRKPIILSIKTQSIPKDVCSNAPKISILPILLRKGVIFIVGSLLFFGRYNVKHVLALPDARKPHFHERMVEDNEIQKEKLEKEDLFEKILERNPNDVDTLKILLYRDMKKGNTDEVVKYLNRLIEVEPNEVEWRLLQALSFELMGDLEEAKRLFREILKGRHLFIPALHGLALAMHKNHEGTAVFEMLNKALELAHLENRVTEERNIRILIAQMHVVKGELEDALKLFQDLIDEDHRDFRPYLCQGITYSLLGKKKEADEQLEIYHNLIPEEYPEKGFINKVILSAKAESNKHL